MFKAMWLMLQQDRPDDFVIATGVCHSVQDLVEVALDYVGLDWREWAECPDAPACPEAASSAISDA
jgi:GDP-D-mannose dehydratase